MNPPCVSTRVSAPHRLRDCCGRLHTATLKGGCLAQPAPWMGSVAGAGWHGTSCERAHEAHNLIEEEMARPSDGRKSASLTVSPCRSLARAAVQSIPRDMPQLVPNSSRQAVTVDTPAASLLQGPKKKIENRKSTQRFPAAAVSISMASAENLSTGWGRAVGCSAPPGAASGDHPFPQAAMPPCRFTPWAKHTPPDRQQGQPARHACCLARMARVAARNPCLVGPTISRLLGHGAALVLPHVLRKTQFHPESKQKKSIRIMITVRQTISIRNFIKQCTSLPCQHETS